jgi:hypothetical protein
MNALAHAVHDLVTGETATGVDVLPNLSSLEQTTLGDLRSLLRLPPRDLAAILAQGQWQNEWLSLTPLVCDHIHS